MFDLKPYHTFGFAAQAKGWVDITDPLQIPSLQLTPHTPFLLLGQGSNCVFVEDFDGIVVHINILGKKTEVHSDGYRLTVNAGENWHELVEHCIQSQIYGFENLALIPGTVGAAPIQNIGAYGVEIARFIESVHGFDIVSGKPFTLTAEECRFGYRDSIFKRDMQGRSLITQVVFWLPKKWQAITHYGELAQLNAPTPLDIFNKVMQIRQQKLPDPKQIGNAGSFFKNPLVSRKHFAALLCDWPELPYFDVDQNSVKVPAGWLIEQLGFKGKRDGGIQCHPKQALVLTNDGNGTGEQLLNMARLIQKTVYQAFSIRLENEVRLIGKKGLIAL